VSRDVEEKGMSAREAWEQIQNWMEANAPGVLDAFDAPVDGEEIADAEKTLGFGIPEQLRELFELFNGASEAYVFGRWYPLSVADMLDERQTNLDVAKEVARSTGAPPEEVWHPSWLPFCSDGGGNFLAIDGAGEVLLWDHEEGEAHSLAESPAAWLSAFADQLEAGRYEAEEDCLVEAEEDEEDEEDEE
jgi:internalin A